MSQRCLFVAEGRHSYMCVEVTRFTIINSKNMLLLVTIYLHIYGILPSEVATVGCLSVNDYVADGINYFKIECKFVFKKL